MIPPDSPETLLAEWKTGDAVSVGRQILEPLSPEQRVARAASILELSSQRCKRRPEIEAVADLARRPEEWNKGHKAFDAVRALTLQEDSRPTNRTYAALLMVAEITAKLIYNATDPIDPFDEDTSWWLASVARSMSEVVGDEAFESEIWRRLTT